MAPRHHTSSPSELRLHPLFVAAQEGTPRAYAALLSAIREVALAYVSRKIGAHSDRDDVVQEIILSVHKALHTYDPARPCMPWLATVMHYRITDWLRVRYRHTQQIQVPLDEVIDFLAQPVTAEPFAYESLHKAVAGLSAGQQAVIGAMYQEDLSVVETAQKLGMGVSAVKVTAHRAYKALRGKLEEQ